jgi:aconitate hydratase
MLEVRFRRADGSEGAFEALCRIDTMNELDYFYAGGILHYVLRKLAA